MLPRAYLVGQEACIHGFTSLKSLWKNIQQRDDISYLWRKKLRGLSGRKKKKPRTFFETIWNQKAGEWSTTRKWPLKITPPMGNFYQIASLLSAASTRLSSSNVRGSWEWAHSQREKGSHREEVLQSPRFGVSRQGICGCFFFNPVPKRLSRSPRERQW